MQRTPLVVIGALLGALLLAAGAAAMPTESSTTHETCVTSSGRVVGGTITGKLTASNVDPPQAQFATCGQAKRTMKKVASLGLEQPRGNVGGFYCVPTVFFTEPDFVLYRCTFKSADTAEFVKLLFAVQYKS